MLNTHSRPQMEDDDLIHAVEDEIQKLSMHDKYMCNLYEWIKCLQIDYKRCEYIEKFSISLKNSGLKNIAKLDLHLISFDVRRQRWMYTSSLRKKLELILYTFCELYGVAYWQGMHDIGAAILRLIPSPSVGEAVSILEKILRLYSPSLIQSHSYRSLPVAQEICSMWRLLFLFFLPRVCRHVEKTVLHTTWNTEWFHTLNFSRFKDVYILLTVWRYIIEMKDPSDETPLEYMYFVLSYLKYREDDISNENWLFNPTEHPFDECVFLCKEKDFAKEQSFFKRGYSFQERKNFPFRSIFKGMVELYCRTPKSYIKTIKMNMQKFQMDISNVNHVFFSSQKNSLYCNKSFKNTLCMAIPASELEFIFSFSNSSCNPTFFFFNSTFSESFSSNDFPSPLYSRFPSLKTFEKNKLLKKINLNSKHEKNLEQCGECISLLPCSYIPSSSLAEDILPLKINKCIDTYLRMRSEISPLNHLKDGNNNALKMKGKNEQEYTRKYLEYKDKIKKMKEKKNLCTNIGIKKVEENKKIDTNKRNISEDFAKEFEKEKIKSNEQYIVQSKEKKKEKQEGKKSSRKEKAYGIKEKELEKEKKNESKQEKKEKMQGDKQMKHKTRQKKIEKYVKLNKIVKNEKELEKRFIQMYLPAMKIYSEDNDKLLRNFYRHCFFLLKKTSITSTSFFITTLFFSSTTSRSLSTFLLYFFSSIKSLPSSYLFFLFFKKSLFVSFSFWKMLIPSYLLCPSSLLLLVSNFLSSFSSSSSFFYSSLPSLFSASLPFFLSSSLSSLSSLISSSFSSSFSSVYFSSTFEQLQIFSFSSFEKQSHTLCPPSTAEISFENVDTSLLHTLKCKFNSKNAGILFSLSCIHIIDLRSQFDYINNSIRKYVHPFIQIHHIRPSSDPSIGFDKFLRNPKTKRVSSKREDPKKNEILFSKRFRKLGAANFFFLKTKNETRIALNHLKKKKLVNDKIHFFMKSANNSFSMQRKDDFKFSKAKSLCANNFFSKKEKSLEKQKTVEEQAKLSKNRNQEYLGFYVEDLKKFIEYVNRIKMNFNGSNNHVWMIINEDGTYNKREEGKKEENDTSFFEENSADSILLHPVQKLVLHLTDIGVSGIVLVEGGFNAIKKRFSYKEENKIALGQTSLNLIPSLSLSCSKNQENLLDVKDDLGKRRKELIIRKNMIENNYNKLNLQIIKKKSSIFNQNEMLSITQYLKNADKHSSSFLINEKDNKVQKVVQNNIKTGEQGRLNLYFAKKLFLSVFPFLNKSSSLSLTHTVATTATTTTTTTVATTTTTAATIVTSPTANTATATIANAAAIANAVSTATTAISDATTAITTSTPYTDIPYFYVCSCASSSNTLFTSFFSFFNSSYSIQKASQALVLPQRYMKNKEETRIVFNKEQNKVENLKDVLSRYIHLKEKSKFSEDAEDQKELLLASFCSSCQKTSLLQENLFQYEPCFSYSIPCLSFSSDLLHSLPIKLLNTNSEIYLNNLTDRVLHTYFSTSFSSFSSSSSFFSMPPLESPSSPITFFSCFSNSYQFPSFSCISIHKSQISHPVIFLNSEQHSKNEFSSCFLSYLLAKKKKSSNTTGEEKKYKKNTKKIFCETKITGNNNLKLTLKRDDTGKKNVFSKTSTANELKNKDRLLNPIQTKKIFFSSFPASFSSLPPSSFSSLPSSFSSFSASASSSFSASASSSFSASSFSSVPASSSSSVPASSSSSVPASSSSFFPAFSSSLPASSLSFSVSSSSFSASSSYFSASFSSFFHASSFLSFPASSKNVFLPNIVSSCSSKFSANTSQLSVLKKRYETFTKSLPRKASSSEFIQNKTVKCNVFFIKPKQVFRRRRLENGCQINEIKCYTSSTTYNSSTKNYFSEKVNSHNDLSLFPYNSASSLRVENLLNRPDKLNFPSCNKQLNSCFNSKILSSTVQNPKLINQNMNLKYINENHCLYKSARNLLYKEENQRNNGENKNMLKEETKVISEVNRTVQNVTIKTLNEKKISRESS